MQVWEQISIMFSRQLVNDLLMNNYWFILLISFFIHYLSILFDFEWTPMDPTYGRAKAGRLARTYIQQLWEHTGCSPEDLPEAMNDRKKWRERVRDIRASGTTWWWWWWFIHCPLYKCWYVGQKTAVYVNNWEEFVFPFWEGKKFKIKKDNLLGLLTEPNRRFLWQNVGSIFSSKESSSLTTMINAKSACFNM